MTDDPHGWGAFWRLYESGTWEPETRALIDTLQPGDLFVDVGAWIGPVTLWALARGAEVVALEPDPVAYRELCLRAPRAQAYKVAVGVEDGTAYLARNPKDGGALGDSMSRLDGCGVVPVRVRTLPDILGERTPALVKVDVEGYEMTLMPTLAPWLAERRIPVQVSFHGALPDPEWFAGYADVQWPAGPHGDLVARP